MMLHWEGTIFRIEDGVHGHRNQKMCPDQQPPLSKECPRRLEGQRYLRLQEKAKRGGASQHGDEQTFAPSRI